MAWSSESGVAVGISAYTVAAGAIKKLWTYDQPCLSPSGFDIISSEGLAVSSKSEFVVFGSWGCNPTTAEASASFNLGLFKGEGGDGTPIFQDTLPGEIWGVDVDVDASGTTFVAAASWHTKTSPSEVVVYSN